VTVLDLGCGEGNSLNGIKFIGWNEYMPKNKSNFIGLDINKDGLKKAKLQRYNSIVYNLETGILPFKDKVFDYIIAQDIIEHLHSHIKIRKEIYRVLKKKGTLYVKVPCETSPNLWRDYTHKRGYTEESIRQFLEDGKFNIQKFKKYKRTCLLTKNPSFAIKSLLSIIISKVLDHDYTTYSYYLLCSKSRQNVNSRYQ